MTSIHAYGTLTAAEGDARRVSGLLMPFGEQGLTSAGAVTAERGAVSIPDDPKTVLLNVGHDREKPLGWAAEVVETPEGLVATFDVAETPAGDEYLAEVAAGVRRGLSVELSDVVIRAGRLIRGALTDVGAVVRPAFPSALVASDAGELDSEEESVMAVETGVTYDALINGERATFEAISEVAEEPAAEPPAEPAEEAVAARAPMGARLTAGRSKRGVSLSDAHKLIAQSFNSPDRSSLTAALSDVTYSGVASTQVPGWIGELWSGKAYSRKYVPLLNQAALTGLKINGWRWVNRPAMAPYGGDKAEVPSGAVSVEDASLTAKRLAGAWDIDRALFDFGDAEFIQSFLAALTESYARLSDAEAETFLTTAGGGNPTTRGSVPAGVAPAMAAVVDGALAIIDRGNPGFALVSPGDYRSILLTRSDDTLAYLNASLGLETGTLDAFRVIPSAKLDDGEVVVGAKECATFYELGDTPIRVEAEHLSHGGRDLGVFGYVGVLLHDQKAITKVTA